MATNGTGEDEADIFYTVNNTPVTYTYFTVNVLMIAIHIAIIILNSCMIQAIRRSRKIEEPGGHCLISLSAAYIWHGFMMIYTGVYGLANMQQKEECLLRFGIVHSSFILISWANTLLTIDRYLQIEFPFWYKKHVHIKVIWISNLVAATLAIFFGTSTLLFTWYNPKVTRTNICEYFNILPELYLQLFYVITFSGFPFLIVAYSRLLYIAGKHKAALAKLARSTSASRAAKEKQKNWRPVKIVLVICTVYIACWAPPGIYGLVLTIDPEYPKSATKYLSTMAILIMAPSLSAIINPCMYTLHREVKYRFLQLGNCHTKRNHNDLNASTASSGSFLPSRLVKMMSGTFGRKTGKTFANKNSSDLRPIETIATSTSIVKFGEAHIDTSNIDISDSSYEVDSSTAEHSKANSQQGQENEAMELQLRVELCESGDATIF